MSTRRTRHSAKTKELTQQVFEQKEANIRDGGKPEVYLQFALLEQFPQLMEPGNLRPETMKWNSTPGLFKRIPTLPTLMVKPTIWDKWCDGACTYWEPTQLAKDFRPGVALIVCYSPYQDLPQDSLREKKTISLSVVYIPEHWILLSFGEAAYVVNHAQDAKDPLGMISLARIHKKSPFYPDISYREYKQHLTITPLLPTGDGLGLCGYTKNFAVGALHRRPDTFGKGGEITSWAPLSFRKATPRELVLITRSGSKTWGYTGSVPECHNVPMAPLDSFIQLGLDDAREAILPDYTFALCIPGSWPFPSLMDKTILPESYFSEGNLVEEDANTTTVAKNTHKRKGRKTQNRSKSAGTTSSTSEASPAQAKTATQTDEEVLDDTGNPPKGGDSENSRPDPQGPPAAPDQEPSGLPGIPSGDQLPDNGQDNLVPPQPDANTPDLDASASEPLPKLVHPPGLPSLTPPDGSTAATPGLLPGAPPGQDPVTGFPHVPAGDQFMTPLTHTVAHAGGNPHAYSFTGIIEGLKEVCSLMTTGFQHACLDVEVIVQKTLEEATRLNRNFTVAAAQDLDKWAAAL